MPRTAARSFVAFTAVISAVALMGTVINSPVPTPRLWASALLLAELA